ncbi:MAG: enoyl-CoA hydratase/isomerase family protein [Thermoplasmatota archaeon]
MFAVERIGDVALLTMDDGKVNAIDGAFTSGFEKALADASESRAIVLASRAKVFSAGLNLKVLPTLEPPELESFMGGFLGTLSRLYACPRPTVAFVDGPALAGGAFLALACDFRTVTSRATMGLTEMPVGIPFPETVLDVVRDQLPIAELAPAVFQGVVRKGEECVTRGWAHQLGSREEALGQAALLATFNPLAYGRAKAEMRRRTLASLKAFEGKGLHDYMQGLMSPETLEAIMSYFQRVTKA